MTEIHPTAYVHPRAELAADVKIGPLCHVGADVKLGPGCELLSNVTLLGPAEFGAQNTFYPYAVLGTSPQDLKYRGGPTRLLVGSHNTFREHVTANRGTEVDQRSGGVTRLGSHSLFMVGVHIPHDADIGNHVILANAVQLAGHIRLEDYVVVGGVSAMHHFVTVGRWAYVGGMTRVTHDVPPYVKVEGYRQNVRGVNVEGMKRWQVGDASIRAVKTAARMLFRPKPGIGPQTTAEAIRVIEANGLADDEHVRYLLDFLRRKLEFGVHGRVREHARRDTDDDRRGFYQHTGPETAK